MDLLISITSTQVSGSRLWAEDVNLGAFISVSVFLFAVKIFELLQKRLVMQEKRNNPSKPKKVRRVAIRVLL